ncbi:ribulose-phosphate 3-epimerase [Opitutales bacterium]|jgi:ribulose-phosphate 3-epimerase|uniref:ribulose-phosphate 3-epimerase n=1 Tax=Candidatus Chordibacter forsetii TaxID=3381758 RepID=UPI0023118C1E|nr:ribulose-phosphate 3-epimerase [Opitutales bacterium]MDA9119172.1 ribulose-phosphate 3-epimerase [Opitutales bacterium]MDC0363329.1 ribulose-phosphate 3-epimerase [Opitutales bacterium]
MKKILAPSLLAGDHGNLRSSLLEVEHDGREWIHLDLMDGHFVPNLSFGPQTVADLRPHSKLFFDVHLMLARPDLYLDAFIKAGSELITIHLEPQYDHQAALDKIRSAGVKTGLAINPGTPVDLFFPYLDQVDLVLCMTVNPGFGGQSFKGFVLEKVRELAKRRESQNHSFLIEVDGGVGPQHVEECLDSGVDVFVAGTSYYKSSPQERAAFARSIGEE